MDNMPNLFIAGFPKAGTTSLAVALGRHPDIFLPAEKEPHYFYNPTGQTCPKARMRHLYKHAIGCEKYRIDASVWYLHSRESIASIESATHNAKYIVLVRNPVEQAISLHAQMLITGTEHTRYFSEAWGLSEQRLAGIPAGMSSSKHVDPTHLAYPRSCAPCWQLRNLLAHVPRDRIKIILFDDLKFIWSDVRKQVAEYLDIPESGFNDLPHVNQRRQIRNMALHRALVSGAKWKARLKIPFNFGIASRLRLANLRSGRSVKVPPNRTEITKYFATEIDRLERLLNRDLQMWRRNE